MTWIPEKQLAEMLGRHPRTIRRLIKSGTWAIEFTAPNNRRFMYSKKGVDQFLNNHSSLTKNK